MLLIYVLMLNSIALIIAFIHFKIVKNTDGNNAPRAEIESVRRVIQILKILSENIEKFVQNAKSKKIKV